MIYLKSYGGVPSRSLPTHRHSLGFGSSPHPLDRLPVSYLGRPRRYPFKTEYRILGGPLSFKGRQSARNPSEDR